MPTLTIKNMPVDLYEELKILARTNHRSINREVIVCIEQRVQSQPVDVEAMLAKARILREKTATYSISDQEFNQLKNEGRS